MKELSLEVSKTTTQRAQRPRITFTLAKTSSCRTRRSRSGERLMYAPLFAAFSFAGEYKPSLASPRIPMRVDMGNQSPFNRRSSSDLISS
jgi:hypothetical protein